MISLAYNRKNAGSGRNLKGISSGLTTLDLKNLSSQFNQKRDGVQQIIDKGTPKVRSGQFYSKEFFVDRVFAGAEIPDIKNRMQWVLQSFRKRNMNAFRIQGRTPIVDDSKFIQCGVNKPAGQCSSVYIDNKPNPLDAIREKLVNSIRTPNQQQVEDIIFNTFQRTQSLTIPSDVGDYIRDFKPLARDIINAKRAGYWIVEPPTASCEAQ
ncbi:MAG: hypothetical protein KTR16_07055 [Acidiferrobacterales bacterium]|nr:hypothetical protein [Acidiferrobacterales bacterium]